MKDESSKRRDSIKKPSRQRFLISAILILLMMVVVFAYLFLNWEPNPDLTNELYIRAVAVKQLYLETRVRKEPNELTDDDFAKIQGMFITAYGVETKGGVARKIHNIDLSDIKVLEKFTNLRYFTLEGVTYPKVQIPQWMKFLSRFGIIDLNDRFSIDLKPLENLKRLNELGFAYSDIKSLRPLKGLKNLILLNIKNTPVSDLESLKEL